MFSNTDMLEAIEQTQHDTPFCAVCSAPTSVEHEAGSLYLVCSAFIAPMGAMARLAARILPHTRQFVADASASEGAAA
jgi:hypothetical protein